MADSRRYLGLRRSGWLIAVAVLVGLMAAWRTRPEATMHTFPLQHPDGGAVVLRLRAEPEPLLGAQPASPQPAGLRVEVVDSDSGQPVTGLMCSLLERGVPPEEAVAAVLCWGGREIEPGLLALEAPGPSEHGATWTYLVSAPGYLSGAVVVPAASSPPQATHRLALDPLKLTVRGRVVTGSGSPVARVGVWAIAAESASDSAGGGVPGVSPGVFMAQSDEEGKFEIRCSGGPISLQVRERGWMDLTTLQGRLRGRIFALLNKARGVLVAAGDEDVELVVVRPHYVAVRLVDQWGDPVQGRPRLTLGDMRFGLTDVPIRVGKGWLEPRLYGGRPDGSLVAVLSPQAKTAGPPGAKMTIEVEVHGHEKTVALVNVRDPSAPRASRVPELQDVVVRRLVASRALPLRVTIHRVVPDGCLPPEACSLVFEDDRGQPHWLQGSLEGEAGSESDWLFHGVPESVTEVRFADGFGRSQKVGYVPPRPGDLPLHVHMPPATGVVIDTRTAAGKRVYYFDVAEIVDAGWKDMLMFPRGGGEARPQRMYFRSYSLGLDSAHSGAGLGRGRAGSPGAPRFYPLYPGRERKLLISALGLPVSRVSVSLSPGEVRSLCVDIKAAE